MDTKNPLYEIPIPSTDIRPPVRFQDLGGFVALVYEYNDSAGFWRAGIDFNRVRAYRHRAESHCSAWHIQGAYDTLVEVHDSRWLEELRSDTPAGHQSEWPYRHYMIYLDSAGAYEVVAQGWGVIDPTGVPHPDA